MTANQAKVWSLYAGGHTVTEIAQLMGRTKGTVSTTLKTIRRNMQRSNEWTQKSVPCVYASSCFACPLKDCVVYGSEAARINMLPGDTEAYV